MEQLPKERKAAGYLFFVNKFLREFCVIAVKMVFIAGH
jgi:hypothetical protein